MSSVEISSPRDLARYIDHTLLRPDATFAELETLCDQAVEHGFFSVCVNAVHVERCAAHLRSAAPIVCSVVGFPLAACGTGAKLFEAGFALDRGADEIDMVLDLGALKSGDDALVQADVAAVADLCHANRATLKVILETCLLDDEQTERACRLALAGGADFLKTSTGFSSGGATIEAVRLLRRAAGPDRGVKASGGIGSAKFALDLIRAGAARLGCSRSVEIVSANFEST